MGEVRQVIPKMNAPDPEIYKKIKSGKISLLLSRCILKFEGVDHVRYLNGQLTQQVTSISHNEALFSAVTNAKGKMDGEIWVSKMGESIYVDIPDMLAETLLARFEKYIISDDVTIHDVSQEWDIYHVLGVQNFSNIPFFRSKRMGEVGTDFWLPKNQSPSIDVGGHALWETVRIENRFPKWGDEMTTDTLPPELGLDEMMISYKKGCYIGQEVISRIKSIGHPNRYLRLLATDSNEIPSCPSECFVGDQKAGYLTSACRSLLHKKVVALGLIHRHYSGLEQPLESHGKTWKIIS